MRLRYLITALLLFLSLFASAQAGMMLASPAAAPEATYLLDTYTGAVAAYAVNKLKSDADSCMVIRRSSDNATALIGFSGDDIDESAITSHCSGTDCFVVRWSDQMGNGNDAIQESNSAQPLIVAGGVIQRQNGILAINFDGINDFLSAGVTFADLAAAFSIFCAVDINADQTGYKGIFSTDTNGNSGVMMLSNLATDNKWGTYGSGSNRAASSDIAPSSGIILLEMISSNGESGSFYLNGASDGTFSFTQGQTTARVGGALDQFSQIDVQSLIIYPTDQSTNRTGIESNINSYYSIY